MVECIAEYTNDPISIDQRDPDMFDSGRYMFEKLNDEGHDARFFRFSPNEEIEGGHEPPINEWMWQIGCLGMTPTCSEVQVVLLYFDTMGVGTYNYTFKSVVLKSVKVKKV